MPKKTRRRKTYFRERTRRRKYNGGRRKRTRRRRRRRRSRGGVHPIQMRKNRKTTALLKKYQSTVLSGGSNERVRCPLLFSVGSGTSGDAVFKTFDEIQSEINYWKNQNRYFNSNGWKTFNCE